jgi:hypothetical protein
LNVISLVAVDSGGIFIPPPGGGRGGGPSLSNPALSIDNTENPILLFLTDPTITYLADTLPLALID